MSISNCPKCEGEVLLPASTDAAARVKCPLCDEEYTLGDVLEKLPAALVLLDVPVLAETSLPSGDFGAMFGGDGPAGGFSFDADGPGLQLAEDGDSSGVSLDGEGGPPATATLTTSPRKQKPKKSIGKELVKIVLGGVGGLVIAYGILLWGFGRDPLPIAPELPVWMNWAVPEGLRARAVKPKSKKKKSESKKQKAPRAASDGGEEGPKPVMDFVAPTADDEIKNKFDAIDSPEFDPLDSLDTSDDPAELPSLDEPKRPNDAPPDELIGTVPDDAPLDPLDTLPVEPAADTPADEKTADSKPADTKPDDSNLPAGAPALRITEPITAENLSVELEKVRSAIETLSPDDPVDKAEVTKQKFVAFGQLCRLAWARTRAESASDNSPSENGAEKQQLAVGIEEADGLIADIAGDQRQAKVIGQLANVALTRDLAENGMVLTGRIGDITQLGKLHRMSVVLPAWEPNIKVRVVTVFCSDPPKLGLDDQILVVGAVVSKPADQIVGFGGKNEQVIWAAGLRRLSSPAE